MEVLKGIFLVVAIALVTALVLGSPTMWLWNGLMPDIFGLPKISFSQAIGIYVLAQILFKDNSTKSSD